jgi:hypothetical protein
VFSALEEDIPITNPAFYSSELLCPDDLLEHIFRPAVSSTENIPLLQERIAVMREVGFILCAVRLSVSLSARTGKVTLYLINRALVAPFKGSSTNFIEDTNIKAQPSNLFKW